MLSPYIFVLIVYADVSSSGNSPPNLMDALTDQQGTPISPEVLEKNKKCLAAMDNLQVNVFLCCWHIFVCCGPVDLC